MRRLDDGGPAAVVARALVAGVADDGDRLVLVVGEREGAALVFEQHAALLGELLGEALVRLGADHGVDLRR